MSNQFEFESAYYLADVTQYVSQDGIMSWGRYGSA